MMKRTIAFILTLLLIATTAITATAETSLLSVTTDAQAQGVLLMDDSGRSISETLSENRSGDQVDWTMRVTNSGASTATLYTMDESGNWLKSNMVYELSWFFGDAAGDGQQSLPQEQAAGGNPWQVQSCPMYDISIIELPSDERVQSRCGPSRDYHGAGAYKTYKIQSTRALFVEGGYVFVDLTYQTVRRRRIYFSTSAFYSVGNVPNADLSEYGARTTAKLIPRFGPGEHYDDFEEAEIGANTAISVFFEEDGWVFCEFDCALGAVRAWLPVGQVEAD